MRQFWSWVGLSGVQDQQRNAKNGISSPSSTSWFPGLHQNVIPKILNHPVRWTYAMPFSFWNLMIIWLVLFNYFPWSWAKYEFMEFFSEKKDVCDVIEWHQIFFAPFKDWTFCLVGRHNCAKFVVNLKSNSGLSKEYSLAGLKKKLTFSHSVFTFRN